MVVLGTKHQGLGKKQIEQRENSESIVLEFLEKNQPVYYNQILRDSKISDSTALRNAIERLLDNKQIRIVLDPKGPKNKKYYGLRNYQQALTPFELENAKKIPSKINFVNAIIKKFNVKKTDSKKELLDKINLYLKRHFKLELTIQDYKNMILLNETTLTKKHVCKIYHITPEAMDQRIKRSKELQSFQNILRKEIDNIKRKNQKIIPQLRNNILMIAYIKNSIAKKYGY
jgi:uncharacterized protein (DUF2164 family)